MSWKVLGIGVGAALAVAAIAFGGLAGYAAYSDQRAEAARNRDAVAEETDKREAFGA